MADIHLAGIRVIQNLQTTFQEYDQLMLFLSHMGDPRNAFLVYFPIAYYLDKVLGVKVMWAAVLSEWVNAILKWILHGHRPYWWIQENVDLYDKESVPSLEQFHLTCETGPGSPSGHAMVTASVLFLLVMGRPKPQKHSSLTTCLGYATVVMIMLCICVSRCFIATHFPHQVLLGTVVGVLIAYVCNHLPVNNLFSSVYISVSTMVIISGLITYYSLEMLGFDPMWCVSLAIKWCAKPEWIYLDTTLFFALVRDSSSLLGLWLVLSLFQANIQLHSKWTHSTQSIIVRTLCIVISILVTRGQEYVPIPHNPQMLFYVLAYAKYCVLPIVVIGIIPVLMSKLCSIDVLLLHEKNS